MQKKPDGIVIFQSNQNGIASASGIRVVAKMHSEKTSVLIEYKHFKAFLENETSQLSGWTKSAEFYHNFDGMGFAGIDCFNQSHISVRTFPGLYDILVDIFISSEFQDYQDIGSTIFNNTIAFFEANVISQQIHPNSVYYPRTFTKS